jgi:HAD superfamily hydrolase (TIGR01509 family)
VATDGNRATVSPPADAEALTAEWCDSLDSGHAAVEAASLYLKATDLAEHNRRLEAERAQVVPLLRDLAHEQHRRGLLVRWLATPRHTKAMLGLPAEIDACVFDLDGVLAASDALHAEAWADTLDPLLLARASPKRFVPFDRRHDYVEHFAARPRVQGIRSFLAARGLSLPEGSTGDPPGITTVAALSARKNDAIRRRLEREGLAAFEESHCYLEAARMLGIRRGVVSASKNTAAMLERADLARLVDVCVDGLTIEAEGLEGKPAPDTLLAACRRLGVPPERTASFETTSVGLDAARAAGMGLVVEVGSPRPAADVSVRSLGVLFMT